MLKECNGPEKTHKANSIFCSYALKCLEAIWNCCFGECTLEFLGFVL